MTEVNSFAVGMEAATGAVQQQGAAEQQDTPPEVHPRYTQLRDKLQEEVNQHADGISNAQDMTAGEKSLQLNVLWDKAIDAEKRLTELYSKELDQNIAEAEKGAYRVPPKLMDSTRAAYQMVSTEVDYASYTSEGFEGLASRREKLQELYSRATRTQDKALQLACYHYALEHGIDGIAEQHRSTSPELTRAFEKLNQAKAMKAHWESNEQRLFDTLDGSRGLVKPPMMRGGS